MKTEDIATTARALADISVALGNPETESTAKLLLEKLNRNIESDAKRAEIMARASKGMMQIEGPRMWSEWHKRALAGDPQEDSKERDWINAFVQRVPCGECKGHFVPLVQTYFRQGFSDYFAKTVAIHNEVNRRLGKPEITTEEARQLWSETAEPARA